MGRGKGEVVGGRTGGIAWVALAGVLLLPAASEGQLPRLIAEGRLGAAVPTGDLSGESPEGGANAGPSFGAGFAFAVRGGLYVNLGFSQHRFGCSEGCAGLGDLAATGFDLALRYGFVAGPVLPYVRAGALPYTVEGSAQGEAEVDPLSDHVWGWELGGGVGVPLSEHVHLSPGLRYVSMDPRFDELSVPDSEEGVELAVRAWILDLGLVWAF
jgi:opacity protein-like surface antigen